MGQLKSDTVDARWYKDQLFKKDMKEFLTHIFNRNYSPTYQVHKAITLLEEYFPDEFKGAQAKVSTTLPRPTPVLVSTSEMVETAREAGFDREQFMKDFVKEHEAELFTEPEKNEVIQNITKMSEPKRVDTKPTPFCVSTDGDKRVDTRSHVNENAPSQLDEDSLNMLELLDKLKSMIRNKA